MTSNPPTKLSYPARCLISCSKHDFDEHAQGYGIFFVKEVVQYASGDYKKTSLLGSTVIGQRVYIVFDYDNPDHKNTCDVLGFKLRPSIGPFRAPASLVHSTVNGWASENQRLNLSFPRQSQITPSPKRSRPCRPPSDSATAEKNTVSDPATAKERLAKHPHSDNEEEEHKP